MLYINNVYRASGTNIPSLTEQILILKILVAGYEKYGKRCSGSWGVSRALLT